MPIAADADGNVAITGESINLFHVMQLRSVLGLEIKTGRKFSNRGSLVETAIRCGYSELPEGTRGTAKVKRQVYGELNALIVAAGGMNRPLPEATK